MADTIIERPADTTSSTLMIGLLIIALLVVAFFLFGGSRFLTRQTAPQNTESQSQGGEGGNINVDVPERIDVNFSQ